MSPGEWIKLAFACLLFLGLLIAYLYIRFRQGGEAKRRDDALDKFRAIHGKAHKRRTQKMRKDAVDPKQMRGEIEDAAQSDGRKAAENLRHFLDQ